MNRNTIAKLMQKSDIDQQLEPYLRRYESGHIYWIGEFTDMGKPIVEIRLNKGFADVDPRRLLWALRYQYYPSKYCTFIRRRTCKRLHCINPEHFKLVDMEG